MHDNSRITENRVNRVLIERIMPTETLTRTPLDVRAHHVPGEPCALAELDSGAFTPISPGDHWGPPWATTWFAVSGQLDSTAAGVASQRGSHGLDIEVQADIGFTGGMAGFQAEAAVYVEGLIRCGVHPRRRAIPLDVVTVEDPQAGPPVVEFLLEAAANPDFTFSFTANPMGDPATAGDSPLYTFRGVELVTYHVEVRELVRELSTLNDLMRVMAPASPRRQRLTAILADAMDTLELTDVPGSAPAVREVLRRGLDVAAAPDSHRLTAVGHAHIDTGWLWPIRETRRKCARTFANQVQLMDRYPEHRFVCSQALQYEFIREDHPELFEQIRGHAARGAWVPVGAMWVEADMNLPSGESIVRQLTTGQRFFEEHFGHRCDEVWIPDVFGYPGGLPQIFRQAGCTRFLTQKLSWNKQNRFPHHTFTWEGIDGSTVAAHFPPVETYNSELSPRELTFASENFSDHGWSDHSLVPFGYGDGGGGPTAEMLERARLLSDVAGLPHLGIRSPSEFFEDIEEELSVPGTPHWRGELYFEMHRGTLTTQADTKVGNRRCEVLLREVELWAATVDEPRYAQELDSLWKRVLTQQFHDILPGSSIAWVHRDAEREHALVSARLSEILAELLDALPVAGDLVVNSATHSRCEVLVSDTEPGVAGPVQNLADGRFALLSEVPGMGVAALRPLEPRGSVSASTQHLSNDVVSVTFDDTGSVSSIVDLRVGRELVPTRRRCAALQIAADHPVEYDAWDLEAWTAASSVDLPDATTVEVIESGPLIASVAVTRSFGSSKVTQTFTLREASPRLDITLDIDWHEDEKYLSIDFPLDVRTDKAACEVQFGHVERPTHASTSWDAAKFEVCAHRWVDLAEPGFGVAILNDGRYGHALQGGGIRVSLLRAPMYPDPTADRGFHTVTVSLLPHGPGLGEVMSEAEALNTPLRVRPAPRGSEPADASATPPAPLVSVDDRRLGISAVKLADDGSGDLVVRLWEGVGDRVAAVLRTGVAIESAHRCNLLEEADPTEAFAVDPTGVHLELRPFELVTLRLRRADSSLARSRATK